MMQQPTGAGASRSQPTAGQAQQQQSPPQQSQQGKHKPNQGTASSPATPPRAQQKVAQASPAAKAKASHNKPCKFVSQPGGCSKGAHCQFRHATGSPPLHPQSSVSAAAAATAGKPATPRLAPARSPPLAAAAAPTTLSAEESAAAAAAAKRTQAARLFALMQAGTVSKQGGGGGGSSANKRSSSKAAATSRSGGAGDGGMSLDSFDLGALILSSKDQQLKAARGRASSQAEEQPQQQLQQQAKAGEQEQVGSQAATEQQQQHVAERLSSLLSSSPAKASASGTGSGGSGGAPSGSSASAVTAQFRALYERCKAEEVQLGALLKQQLHADSRVSAQTQQQNRARITSLRASIRSGYAEMMTRYSPRLAVQKGVAQKLWQSMYREMERLLAQAKERQAASAHTAQQAGSRQQQQHAGTAAQLDLFASSAAEEKQQAHARLQQLLDTNFTTLDQLAKNILEQFPGLLVNGGKAVAKDEHGEDADANAEAGAAQQQPALPPQSRRSPETLAAAKQLLSALCVCLGDLERYRQQFLAAGRPNWDRCVFFYTRSLLLDPLSPSAAKSHNQLACVASYGTSGAGSGAWDAFAGHAHFKALYHYVRARHTPLAPFLPARENTLALFEENRLAYESNRPLVPGCECSLLLCGLVRLFGLLDTRVGMESWDGVFTFVLKQQLKTVLNASFFSSATGGAGTQQQSASLSEGTMLHAVLLVLFYIDGLVAKDRAAAAGTGVGSVLASMNNHINPSPSAASDSNPAQGPSLTPTTLPPFPLSQLTRQALSVLYALLDVLVRIPVLLSSSASTTAAAASSLYASRPIPFLPSLALASLWLHSSFPWALTAHEEASSLADEAQLGPSPRESVRIGLAALANLLAPLESSAPVAAAHQSVVAEASLFEPHGFAPLMQQRLWPSKPCSLSSAPAAAVDATGAGYPASSGSGAVCVDSFAFQSGALLSLARAVLFVHPRSGRLSAHPVALSALSADEQADLAAQQEAWVAARAAEEEKKRRALLPSKPKRPSKQAKPRPLRDPFPVAGETPTVPSVAPDGSAMAVVHGEGAGSMFAGMTDAEADEELVFVDPAAILPQADTDASSSPPQRHLSEMEALVSDEALGISPVLPPQPQPTSASASGAGTGVGATPLSLSASLLPVSSGSSKPLLVLDGPNIAMRHGLGRLFSMRGLELALELLSTRLGHRCLIFAPAFVVDMKLIGERRRAQKIGMDVKAASMPDNVQLLRAWADEGRLVTTPSQDYDDSYAVQYAMRHPNALLVSCDQYRDYPPAHAQSPQEEARLRAWLRAHVVSFAFVADSFMLNPEWKADPITGLRRVVKAEQGYCHGHGYGQQQQQQHRAQTHATGASTGSSSASSSSSSTATAIPSYRILR